MICLLILFIYISFKDKYVITIKVLNLKKHFLGLFEIFYIFKLNFCIDPDIVAGIGEDQGLIEIDFQI